MCVVGVASPAAGVVHDVVVEQREGVHQLQRRAGIDDPLIVCLPAGADESPVTERRTQPLAAAKHEPADVLHRQSQVFIERRPASGLDVEHVPQPGFDAGRDGRQRRRRGGCGHTRRLGVNWLPRAVDNPLNRGELNGGLRCFFQPLRRGVLGNRVADPNQAAARVDCASTCTWQARSKKYIFCQASATSVPITITPWLASMTTVISSPMTSPNRQPSSAASTRPP